MSGAAAAGLMFGVTAVMALFAISYAIHDNPRFEAVVGKWWGPPAVLIGIPALMLGAALLASEIAFRVLS